MSNRRPTRHAFLDPAALDAAAAEVAERIPHAAAAGGYAMHLYGSDRLTGDLDVVVARALDVPAAWRTGHSRLTLGGVRVRSSGGVPIDVIARTDDYAPLYRDACRHAVRMAAVPVRVWCGSRTWP